MTDVLRRDYKEAVEFRDEMRKECKEFEKELASQQKERMSEMADTKRALKEKQDLYAGIDSYLLRSGGSRGLSSSTSTISMDYDKVAYYMILQVPGGTVYYTVTNEIKSYWRLTGSLGFR